MSKFLSKLSIIVVLILSLFVGCSTARQQTTKKPVIYLYPTEEQKVSVNLEYDGKLTFTYPEYDKGWNVIAKPDGTIFNLNDKKEYSYLFWEGETKKRDWDTSKGFVVKGKDTREFLQRKLSQMGLLPKEYNEFIVYWLPQMQDNKYNLIHFSDEEYSKMAKLRVVPEPNSLLRIFMVFKKLDKPLLLEEQEIKPFERNGFTVVEWGGTELK